MSWTKGLLYGAGIVGLGYLLLRTTTPSEEKLYQALSPELKQEADRLREDKEKRQRQIGLMIKQNMQSDRPEIVQRPAVIPAYHAVPHWTNPDTADEDRRRHEEAIAKRRQELLDTLGYDWPRGDLPKAIIDLKDQPRFHGEL
ncbi:assembly factor cbp4 [Dimargaris xerosporica]|nr:assembly factor cbp4 [Dimargaris xerosporica]